MKQRPHSPLSSRVKQQSVDALADVIVRLGHTAAVRRFLEDLCTPTELEAMADRWRVVPFLINGMSYRDIQEITGVSVTTIGRVARTLGLGAGGYREALRVERQHSQPSQEASS